MKKLFLLLLLVPLLSFSPVEESINIVGKWKGIDKNEIGYITFDSIGYALIESNGKSIGGKEFDMNGNKASMNYSINLDTIPIHIDFTITVLESKEQSKLLFIAKFHDKNTMTLASNFNSERPKEFNSKNSVKMSRVE